MTATTSQAHTRATPRRARILDQTLRIVSERGYHGFGIQELAQRSLKSAGGANLDARHW
jgi:AcrR family transcriptional regulator